MARYPQKTYSEDGILICNVHKWHIASCYKDKHDYDQSVERCEAVYFRSLDGGDEPRRGDFGETGEGGLAKLR